MQRQGCDRATQCDVGWGRHRPLTDRTCTARACRQVLQLNAQPTVRFNLLLCSTHSSGGGKAVPVALARQPPRT
jgi:hypothetical protein